MEVMSEMVINQVAARAGMPVLLRACQHALQLRDVVLLAVLREFVLDADEPNVMVSVRELAQITEDAGLLTKSQIETSLKRLVDAGALIREQRDKRNREIAVTTLLPLAFQLLEGTGSQKTTVMPLVLRGLLAGEHRDVIEAVQTAWDNSDLPDASVAPKYRGGSEGWDRIEALLRGRIEESGQAIEAAVLAQEERDERRRLGLYRIVVADGSEVEIDAHAIERDAPAPCNVEVAVEVLEIAEQARPGTITRKNVHARLAEALYSRHVGFARHLDAAKAIRVIGRQMAKDTWGRPYSIRDSWYSVCLSALSAPRKATCAQVS